MRFIFEQVRVGGDRNFGYLIGDREAHAGVLVDPSYSPEVLVERARAQGLKITHILNTHGHADHTEGNPRAKALTGAVIAAGEGSSARLDLPLHDGDRLAVGAYSVRVWHVPGHCRDHLAFLVEGQGAGLTGDLLFVGKIGGTHSDEDARTEWDSLHRLLRDWPDETTIWPGHDYGARPSSTLAWERRLNPFLTCKDFAEFLRLKEDWPEFKVRHGLK
jgi:hydroxyacylglutathione hydrolase